jgi:aspartate aminotransferase-like enzyme
MREALQIVGEVGLANMWATHKRLHEDLWRGLAPMGLQPFVERPADRLVTVNTIKARPGAPARPVPELFGGACWQG